MTPKQIYYENAAKTIIKNLENRQMEGYYCASSQQAVEKALSLIPAGASIGWGGSMSLSETGLSDALRRGKYVIYDRDAVKSGEEQKKVFAQIFSSDYFLMSTNAITLDGELINVDGRGNRVSFLCYGPEHVLIVAGMNKVVSDVQCGIKRVHDVASPANTVRLHKDTPCSVTGRCADCLSPGCICSQTVITRFSIVPGRIKVILIGEELGY